MNQITIDPRVNVVFLKNKIDYLESQVLLYMQNDYTNSLKIQSLEKELKEIRELSDGD